MLELWLLTLLAGAALGMPSDDELVLHLALAMPESIHATLSNDTLNILCKTRRAAASVL